MRLQSGGFRQREAAASEGKEIILIIEKMLSISPTTQIMGRPLKEEIYGRMQQQQQQQLLYILKVN